MARGKHKARSANQRRLQLEATIVELRSELEMESAALTEAEGTLEKVNRIQSELKAENAALLEEVTPYAAQLRQERDYLRTVFSDASSHHSRIQEAWNRYVGAAIDVSPGTTNLEQLESVQHILGLGGFLNSSARPGGSENLEEVTRIQRARGQRRNVAEDNSELARETHLTLVLDLQMVRPTYRQLLIDEGIIAISDDQTHRLIDAEEMTEAQKSRRTEAIEAGKRVWQSHPGSLDSDAVLAWGTGSLIATSTPATEPRLALGFTPGAKADEHDASFRVAQGLPLPSTPAATRNAIARQRPEDTLGSWRSVFETRQLVAGRLGMPSHPFAPLAHHPHPGQGLATQNTYALAAFSGWIHHGAGSAYAEAAIGLTAAATYWLPAGQTASFAESEPMDESDRAEMILPFPQVFLAFAEPLVLDPVNDVTPPLQEIWTLLSEVSHDVVRTNSTVGSAIEHLTHRAGPDGWTYPTIDEMIAGLGAHIEGVLLLADSLGRPDDSFAWCLTIPGAYGSTLGRFVVPARRSATEYRDVVDNLTAVVAWAQWHEPDQSTAIPLGVPVEDLEDFVSSKDFQRNAKRAGAGIRVVDVGSTNRAGASRSTRDSDGGDVHVAPHIRRGHWRRQRFGLGREQIKRIRIAPVLVNAHRGDIAPRVYRLRSNRVVDAS